MSNFTDYFGNISNPGEVLIQMNVAMNDALAGGFCFTLFLVFWMMAYNKGATVLEGYTVSSFIVFIIVFMLYAFGLVGNLLLYLSFIAGIIGLIGLYLNSD
tara:strand:+ start:861 stop:1163 length:303 start_codon:yes stop_codon:yes gene_type:complete